MSHCSNGIRAIIVVLLGSCGQARAYEDDDLLCRPGWSPELLQQQMWQQYDQQRAMYAEHQYSIAYAAGAEQRNLERAKLRRARSDKAARQREELLAKRKAGNATKTAVKAAPMKAANKTSIPIQ